jgi:hypothetical protein
MLKDDTVRIIGRLSVGYPEMIHACGRLEGVTLVDAPDAETFARAIPNARVVVSHNRLQAGSCPESAGKEKWRILPVGEVHDQRAALQGGHRRHTPWQGYQGRSAGAGA